jgi:uncharacterized protein
MSNPSERAAIDVLELAQAGRFAEIRERFTPGLQAMVVPSALALAWITELATHGPITSVGAPVSEAVGAGAMSVKLPVLCERDGFTFTATVNEAGELMGLQLTALSAAAPVAPWEAPAYADPRRFGEREVTVGSGPLAVAGTLSLPQDPRQVPGVVLLAGSGPLDRDETIGRNKPLKDIAWGLASRGVAVLRFDKVTYTHASELRTATGFTLADEYVPAATAAVGLLAGEPAVDAGKVFVLGHSLGGTVAPRVAAGVPSVAGLILLAGGAQPLHWATVRQARYLASLTPETEAASQPAIQALADQAGMVDSPELSASTPTSLLPLGAPASYWLDVRGYDPVQTAAALHKPTLILQGGRDYQVTVDDDLARWTAGLEGDPAVAVRLYPRLNHLFTPGSGPCSPAEYEPVQHVDPVVVGDIAAWIVGGGDRAGNDHY